MTPTISCRPLHTLEEDDEGVHPWYLEAWKEKGRSVEREQTNQGTTSTSPDHIPSRIHI
jgi:hypothetical protein